MKGSIAVGGAALSYEEAGEGPAVVFLHAGICDSRMWEPQVAPFAASYRTIRYDRRGFGRTPMVAGEFSGHGDLVALLDALGVERTALVGCSQGGRVALELALEAPERVAALVLVSSALPGFAFDGENPGPWAEIDEACERGDLDLANELELRAWVDGASRAPADVDPTVRELVRDMNGVALRAPSDLGRERPLDPPVAARLGEIACPALVVTGDLDTPRTLAAADRLASGISGARVATIAGTAHLPSLEQPGEFNRLALEFLAGAAQKNARGDVSARRS